MFEHLAQYFGTTIVYLQCPPVENGGRDAPVVRESERSNEEKVIDQVENAQLEGKLPRDVRETQRVIVGLSKYGMQIMTPDRKLTLSRVPLLNVLFTVAFDDGFGKYHCSIIERSREDSGQCICHVFLVASRLEADRIMKDVDALFDTVQEECRDFETEEE